MEEYFVLVRDEIKDCWVCSIKGYKTFDDAQKAIEGFVLLGLQTKIVMTVCVPKEQPVNAADALERCRKWIISDEELDKLLH